MFIVYLVVRGAALTLSQYIAEYRATINWTARLLSMPVDTLLRAGGVSAVMFVVAVIP